MRIFFFILLLISCGPLSLCAQNDTASAWQRHIREINEKVSRHQMAHIRTTRRFGTPPPDSILSVPQLLNPDSLKKFISLHSGKAKTAKSLSGSTVLKSLGSGLCVDTSFRHLLSIYASWIFVQGITAVSDGGLLIAASLYDTTKANFTWRYYGLLIKTDEDGKIAWIKQFDNANTNTFSAFNMDNAFELPNKDIICTGSLDTTSGLGSTTTIMYRLKPDGTEIWRTGLVSTLKRFLPGVFQIFITSVAEGMNGDLILGGTSNSSSSSGKYETVLRLDKNGNIIWDANYGNDGPYLFGAEGMSVYVENGVILEVGLSHGSGSILPAVSMLTLDYNSGKLLGNRFFRPNYADKDEQFRKSFTYYANNCTRLSNGHFIVSGKLFSDYVNTTPVHDHFGVIEFDAAFNPVKSYTISSRILTNYGNNLLYFDENGKGLLSLLEFKGPLDASLYFGAFEKQQFQNQRRADYSNAGLPGNSGFGYTKNNGYIFAQSYFEGGYKSSIEFKKMHYSDTSSKCLGTNVFLMKFLPLNIIEDPLYSLDSNISNKAQNTYYNLVQNDSLRVQTEDPCRQINYCDTVKIHGNPAICGGQSSVLFTAYKSSSCGTVVQWNIDSAGIDSLAVQNDSSVLVYFKNINWQGKLYATVPAGKCFIHAADSVNVSVVRSQKLINLGPDTVLCKNNQIILHAGNSFSNYRWQDGSGDSVLKVTLPGKYYVTAGDACGNSFSDTINITAAFFPFSIGSDTIRCNNDTIRLTATDGFINYKWLTLDHISADTGRSVNVFPVKDTSYIAGAEKWPGCFVSDTVNIRVFKSPPVHLGNDTSLCNGQSLRLDAGSGFAGYQWGNGETSRQVAVSAKGIYFVKAIAANTCISSDTLEIISISPLPVFTLGPDTVLCQNTSVSYNFDLPGAKYLWNDGSTTNKYSISTPGRHSLTVTQNGCAGKDTIVIAYKINPEVKLGNDTTICAGDSYLLTATNSGATYSWQDGSTSPTFLVDKADTYFVSVNLAGCVARDTIRISYLSQPLFNLGRDTFICAGQTIILQAFLNTPANYLWQDGSTSPDFTVKDAGIFSLEASNICGKFADSVMISAGTCNLFLPSSFSPNGDGLNDLFRVKFPFPVAKFRLSLFNRYGEKLFETTSMDKGWDGKYKGKEQPEGAYVWIVQIKGLNAFDQTEKGTVLIIR